MGILSFFSCNSVYGAYLDIFKNASFEMIYGSLPFK